MTGETGLRRFVRPPAGAPPGGSPPPASSAAAGSVTAGSVTAGSAAPGPAPAAQSGPDVSPLIASMLAGGGRGAGRPADRGRQDSQLGRTGGRRRRRGASCARPRCRTSMAISPTWKRLRCCAPAGRATCCSRGRSAGRRKYRAVPDRYLHDPGRVMSPAEWDQLEIPVGLAFFLRSSRTGGELTGFYPSPAGVTECSLTCSGGRSLSPGLPAARCAGTGRRGGPDQPVRLRRGVLPGPDRRLL